jgi:hypothetical protein
VKVVEPSEDVRYRSSRLFVCEISFTFWSMGEAGSGLTDVVPLRENTLSQTQRLRRLRPVGRVVLDQGDHARDCLAMHLTSEFGEDSHSDTRAIFVEHLFYERRGRRTFAQFAETMFVDRPIFGGRKRIPIDATLARVVITVTKHRKKAGIGT